MRTLLALSILTLSLSCMGQVNRLRANCCVFNESVNSDWKYGEWAKDWDDCDIIIIMDNHESRVKIMNGWDDDFLLQGEPTKVLAADPEGDSLTRVSYPAVDQSGVPCRVWFEVWHEYNLIYVSVLYPNCAYKYSCELIDSN